MSDQKALKKAIRSIKDFPKQGIVFRDITPVLSDSALCKYIIDESARQIGAFPVDAIAGIESRGFLFGVSLAQKFDVAFLPVRKKGKLPHETVSIAYSLEYGSAEIEMHKDAIRPGMKVHIHDDLLATGGTASALARLIEEQGATVTSFSFVIELEDLKGRDKLLPYSNNIISLVVY